MKKAYKRHMRKVLNKVRRVGRSSFKLPVLKGSHKRFYR